MSLFNEIQRPGLNGILHKWLGMKEGAPSPQLSPDIQADISLASDRPEWSYLSGEFRAGGWLSRAADAGNFSAVGLFNGQTTGVLVVVEKILIENTSAAALEYDIRVGNTTALSNTIRGNPMDLRWGGTAAKQSAALIGNNIEAAATGTRIARFAVPAGTTFVFDQPIIMPPNVGQTPVPNVVVESVAVNVLITAGFLWRESTFDPSEVR